MLKPMYWCRSRGPFQYSHPLNNTARQDEAGFTPTEYMHGTRTRVLNNKQAVFQERSSYMHTCIGIL
jgi:hypothetical protein